MRNIFNYKLVCHIDYDPHRYASISLIDTSPPKYPGYWTNILYSQYGGRTAFYSSIL